MHVYWRADVEQGMAALRLGVATGHDGRSRHCYGGYRVRREGLIKGIEVSLAGVGVGKRAFVVRDEVTASTRRHRRHMQPMHMPCLQSAQGPAGCCRGRRNGSPLRRLGGWDSPHAHIAVDIASC